MNLGLGNDAGGQFFTPYDVCLAMAEMTMDPDYLKGKIEESGYITINDPACGAGATLIAAADIMQKYKINFQQSALFIAQDIDFTTALMCYVQLSLLGCAGYVRIGNTLTDPMTGSILHGGNNDEHTWFTPMWYHERWSMIRAVDVVKRMIPDVATAFPQAVEAQTDETMPENEAAEIDDTEPIEAPTIVVRKKSTRKHPEGQLMFEF